MPSPSSMSSQDPALDSFREDILEAGHEETLDNMERGCGFLDHNASYVRSDVQLASADGVIPTFVELDEPIQYREYGQRGAIIVGLRDFPGVQFGWGYVNDGNTTTPAGAIPEHHRRLEDDLSLDGDHYGEITVAHASDILMSVGKTHWPTPEDFITECRNRGLNLKVPSGPTNEPPTVNPFATRCWVVHPNGAAPGRAAIIGYAVLTRVVFTAGEQATADDPDIPTYAADWYAEDKVDLATPGQPIEATDDPTASLAEFEESEEPEEPQEPPKPEEPEPDSVVASDRDSLDVEPADVDGDSGDDLHAAWEEWYEDKGYHRSREVATTLGADLGQNPTREAVIKGLVDSDTHPDAMTVKDES